MAIILKSLYMNPSLENSQTQDIQYLSFISMPQNSWNFPEVRHFTLGIYSSVKREKSHLGKQPKKEVTAEDGLAWAEMGETQILKDFSPSQSFQGSNIITANSLL